MTTRETLPTSPDQISAAWLTGVLRDGGAIGGDVSVASVHAERIGEGVGFVGHIARLRIEYDRPGAGPESLVAKLPSPDPGARTIANAYGLYEREYRFYSELSSRVDIGAPRCYLAASDGEGNYLLLLEDLSPVGRIGDQLHGCDEPEAALAVRALARFHAGNWANPSLDEIAWLQRGVDIIRPAMVAIYPQVLPKFFEFAGDRCPQPIAEILPSFNDKLISMLDIFETRPHTLIHGDYRLDNMFFRDDGAGYPVVMIDWQSPNRSWGTYDLAYFVSGSLMPEDRAACEMRLLDVYRDTLAEHGVRDQNRDELLDDYRRSLLVSMAIGVINGATLEMSNERAVQLFETMFDRLMSAIVDLDALALLPK